jgi:sulfate permease, SulP family
MHGDDMRRGLAGRMHRSASERSMALYRPALLSALKEGYPRRRFTADLSAGLLVGVVALPLSMALAIASGCTPEQGLWTAIIGGFLISLLGGSRVQIGGPAGAFVGLCAVAVNQFGYAGLALATLMAGAFILFLGLARLGRAVSYIPTPVVIGFTTGIALILLSTQIGPALGIAEPAKPVEHLHERVQHLTAHAGGWNWRALVCCVATVVFIVVARRASPKLPGALIALVVVAALSYLLGWDAPAAGRPGSDDPARIATIASRYGDIPASLPAPAFPSLGLGDQWTLHDLVVRLKDLSSLALALALLGAIESLLSAVVADGMTGRRHDSNSELIGQGVANLVTPFFQGMPATGVIARTSTNVRAGAQTPVAGLVHALTVLLIMLLAAPLVGHIPLAALAGVLLVVCWHMAELRHWPHILKAGRGDAFLLPVAFILTAFIGVTEAILVGVVLAMFFFVKRMADATEVEHHQRSVSDVIGTPAIPAGVEVYSVRGPFFFGAATLIRDLEGDVSTRARTLVLRIGGVPFIDATAAFSLRELAAALKRRGGRLVLAELDERARRDLERHDLIVDLGPDAVFPRLDMALAALGGVKST